MLVAVTERPPPPPTREELMADERGRYVVHPEWITQTRLLTVGLLVLSIYLVFTLIGTGAIDLASRISFTALSVAVPLLAVLSLTTELMRNRRYASYPWYFTLSQAIAQSAAVIGFGAALWHVWFVGTIVALVSGLAGVLLYQAYYRRLDKDNRPERAHKRKD